MRLALLLITAALAACEVGLTGWPDCPVPAPLLVTHPDPADPADSFPLGCPYRYVDDFTGDTILVVYDPKDLP